MNPAAPLLDPETIREFQEDPHLREELLVSFELMLRFFGLGLDRNPPRVRELPNFRERSGIWLGSHNLLRITRILICLRTLGLAEYARAFFDFLEQLYARDPVRIGRSFGHWQRAVRD